MILSLTIFVCLALSVHGEKLHEYMTQDEIKLVFNVNSDSMAEVVYELLSVNYKDNDKHADRLDAYIKTSSQEFFLYLEGNKVLLGSDTPIYRGQWTKHFTKTFYGDYFPDGSSLKLYHDYENQAAFVVHTDEHNNRHFDGVIGENLHIRSIPDRLHKELKRNHPAMTNEAQDSIMKNSTYHVIINKSNNNTIVDARNDNSKNNNTSGQGTKIRPPSHTSETGEHTVYPELLISIDYETFKLHGCDIKKIAKYMAAFWNAVDLRYRELKDPQVKLNIAGLVISEMDFDVDFYYIPHLFLHIRYIFNFALKDAIPIDSYDILITMTPKKLIHDLDGNNSNPIGVAYVKGVCNPISNMGFVQDHGSFTGIITAAHELGHSFGTDHDPKETNDIDWKNRFIMRPYIYQTSFKWSQSSKEAMKEFLSSEGCSCVRNKPYVGSPLPKILAGTLLSRNQQCLERTGSNASNNAKHVSDCLILWCRKNNKPDIYLVAEGTSCGMNRICLDGYCVEDSPVYHSRNALWNQ